MYVIGTAGHVDHGKSLLVEALTGIDPDRLREEKARGMTIDLGFAWLTLPSGRSVSIVDVPGHERFIKNMLAGAAGVDVALLVVAADDGVMPQTREHLAILDLLGVSRGVVCLTKRDLVGEDWLALVAADVQELLTGTSLEGSAIVACSSTTRDGLDELVLALDATIDDLAPKRDIGRPRLPIDRVFTIGGFGTVVTGTLIDGTISIGDEIEAVPGGARGRIRGLQSHRDSVERALAGTRTAVNVTGIAKEELRRGTVLARPGTLSAVSSVDARIRAVGDSRRALRHNLRVTFHAGADEAGAQLRLLNAAELQAGESAWAQLKLETPVAVLRGDRFVLRTANDTVAGGIVAAVGARRHRRNDPGTIAALEGMLAAEPAEQLLDIVSRRPLVPLGPARAELGMPAEVAAAALAELSERRLVRTLGDGALVTAAYLNQLRKRARDVLAAYHQMHPLRRTMPAEEFRGKLELDRAAFAMIHPELTEVRSSAGGVALADFAPSPSVRQRAQMESYVAALAAAGTTGASAEIEPELLAYLVETGIVVVVGSGIVFEARAFDEMDRQVRTYIEQHGAITLAEARDLFGSSRRFAQALLEHLDRMRVTRRVGDTRVLW